jgi:site-specific recombinase XerD
MIEDMQLRGLSARTQESYVRVVRQLAEYYHKPPDQLSEEQLRQYFLYLKNEKRVARNTCTQVLCALKFLYRHTLQREWPILEFIRPAREHKLPVILSVEEVRQLLGCLGQPHYRVCLSTIYGCGLRLLEGVRLQVGDMDSGRGLLHVRGGKGNQDRYVPLPERMALSRAGVGATRADE